MQHRSADSCEKQRVLRISLFGEGYRGHKNDSKVMEHRHIRIDRKIEPTPLDRAVLTSKPEELLGPSRLERGLMLEICLEWCD